MGHLSSEKWPAPDAAPNGRPYTSAHLCEFITDGSPVHPLYWAHLSKGVAYGFAKTPPKNGKDRGGLRGLRLLCPRLSPLRHPNLERYHSPGGCRPMRRLRQVRGGVPGYHNYTGGESSMKKRWYDFLWIASLLYLVLGFFNILFAWLGLLCFFIPLVIAFAGGDKGYCNRFCGRGQLFSLLGGRFGLSRRADIPRWMKSKAFRYGFLGFFLLMFFQMLWSTYLVFAGRAGAAPGRHSALDVPAALALGLLWNPLFPRRGPIRLWLLQRHAHLYGAGAGHNGAFQTPLMVCVLPYGHHDPAYLPGEAPGRSRPPLPGTR